MTSTVSFVRLAWVLGLFSALGPLALQILVPALPAIRDEFGTTAGYSQLLLSSYSATLAIAALVYGAAANRWGKRNVLSAGLVVFGIGSAICFAAGSIEISILGRVLQAAGAASTSTITRAVAAERFSGAQLQQAMSAIMLVVVCGPMVAPIFGGMFVESGNWRGIFLMLLVICGLMFLLSRLWLFGDLAYQGVGVATEPRLRYWQQVSRVLSSSAFRINMLILVAVQIGVYAFLSVSPFLIIDSRGYSALSFGFLFMYLTLGYIAGTSLAGLLARRMRSDALVLMAVGCYAVGVVTISGIVFLEPGRIELVVLPALLMTFTNGITQSTCGAAALGATSAHAAVAGSLSAFLQLGAGGVGFQIVALFDGAQPRVLALVISTCAVVAAIGAIVRCWSPRAQSTS